MQVALVTGAKRGLAAAGIVWLATLPDDGPSGGFSRMGSGSRSDGR